MHRKEDDLNINNILIKEENKLNSGIESEPADLELKDNILNEVKSQFRFLSVISTEEDCKNNIFSKGLENYSDNFNENILHCLKGNTLETPIYKFKSVKDIDISNFNYQDLTKAKTEFDIQKALNQIKNESDLIMIKNINRSVEVNIFLYF